MHGRLRFTGTGVYTKGCVVKLKIKVFVKFCGFDISRGWGAANFTKIREIPRKSQKHMKSREIRYKSYQIHAGTTYLKVILAVRAACLL